MMPGDMSSLVFESDCTKLKMDQCLNAHEKQVSWLKKALQQQIKDYEHEWDAMLRHEAKEFRIATVQRQRSAVQQKRTQDHRTAREIREQVVLDNLAILDHEYYSKVQHMLDRESARDERIVMEREQRQEELARLARREAMRHEEVLREGARIAHAVSDAHATKARFKNKKAESLACEAKRIHQLRKNASEQVQRSLASMRHLILQQRNQSIIDVSILKHHMDELVESMQV